MIHTQLSTQFKADKFVEWHRLRYHFHAEFHAINGRTYYVNFQAMTMFWLTDGRLSMVTNQIIWDEANRELYARDDGKLPSKICDMYEHWIAQQILE